MRYTTRYNIPVPQDNDSADVATTVGATADAVDAALYQGVQDSANAGAAAAQTALSDTITARNAAQTAAANAQSAARRAAFLFLGA